MDFCKTIQNGFIKLPMKSFVFFIHVYNLTVQFKHMTPSVRKLSYSCRTGSLYIQGLWEVPTLVTLLFITDSHHQYAS